MSQVIVSNKRGRIPKRGKPLNLTLARQLVGQSKPSVKSLDKRIKKINKKAELKHVDTFDNLTAIPTTGLIIPLNLSTQGNTDITRLGDDIQATSIQWRLQIIADADLLEDSMVRMLIVWDRQPNGAAFTIAQLLDNTVITGNLQAPYNHSFQERFKILHDQTIRNNPSVLLDFDVATGSSTTNQPTRKFVRGKRQLSRTVKYNGNAGTIADIITNSLSAVFISSAAAQPPTLLSGFRFYFKDM